MRHFRADRSEILADAVHWLVVVGLVGPRYVDIRYMERRTAEGQPAAIRDWQRYRLRVLRTSPVLWAAAHVLGDLAVKSIVPAEV